MRRRGISLLAVLCCAVALSVGAAACGKSNSSGTRTIGAVHAAAGFAFHAGLAFGAFKHFIYKPYEAGDLKLSHPFTLAKAAAAGAFAYHELKLASADLKDNQHTAKLARLAAPMLALGGALHLIKSAILHGQGSQAVTSANSQISSIQSQASGLGSPIQTATSGFNL